MTTLKIKDPNKANEEKSTGFGTLSRRWQVAILLHGNPAIPSLPFRNTRVDHKLGSLINSNLGPPRLLRPFPCCKQKDMNKTLLRRQYPERRILTSVRHDECDITLFKYSAKQF
jgi:hypothetical protein